MENCISKDLVNVFSLIVSRSTKSKKRESDPIPFPLSVLLVYFLKSQVIGLATNMANSVRITNLYLVSSRSE